MIICVDINKDFRRYNLLIILEIFVIIFGNNLM